MRLTADSIYYEKNGNHILSGAFLNTQEGEVLGILGRNGSGKSTLFNIIFGALKPNFGSIYIDGIKRRRGYDKRLVQFLPQSGFLPGHISINEVLKLFGQKWTKHDFLELGLNPPKKLKVNGLSTGQKKIFECALLMKTPSPFILLDEPFGGMAPISIEIMQQLIRKKAIEKSIIITDHKYSEILKVSDRLLIISSGQTKAIEKNKEALKLNGYLSDINFNPST